MGIDNIHLLIDPDAEIRRCTVCGAYLSENKIHRHEDPEWKPKYDDLEGALEGYTETNP